MGTYCSNPLDYLIEEYGEDVGKMIVLEKTKQYFGQKYPEVKTDLTTQTQTFQKKFTDQIDAESKTTVDKIMSKVNEMKASKKTQIEAFEKLSNQQIDNMIGINEFNSKVDELKKKSTSQVKVLGDKIISQADVLADKQQQLLEDQKPKLPIYDSLPQCLKDKVWEEGEKKFSGQIDQEKKKAENFFKDNISVDALKNKVGVSLPDDEVKKIGTEFEDKFNTVKQTIEGSSLLGKFKSPF